MHLQLEVEVGAELLGDSVGHSPLGRLALSALGLWASPEFVVLSVAPAAFANAVPAGLWPTSSS